MLNQPMLQDILFELHLFGQTSIFERAPPAGRCHLQAHRQGHRAVCVPSRRALCSDVLRREKRRVSRPISCRSFAHADHREQTRPGSTHPDPNRLRRTPLPGTPRARPDKPLGTVVSGQKHALVSAFLAKHYTGVVGSDMTDPMSTVTTVDHHSLVTANIVKMRGDNGK